MNDRSGDDGPRPSEVASVEASSFQNPLPVEEEHILKKGDEKVTEAAKQQLLKELGTDRRKYRKKEKDITGEITNARMFKHGTVNVPCGDFIFITILGMNLELN